MLLQDFMSINHEPCITHLGWPLLTTAHLTKVFSKKQMFFRSIKFYSSELFAFSDFTSLSKVISCFDFAVIISFFISYPKLFSFLRLHYFSPELLSLLWFSSYSKLLSLLRLRCVNVTQSYYFLWFFVLRLIWLHSIEWSSSPSDVGWTKQDIQVYSFSLASPVLKITVPV